MDYDRTIDHILSILSDLKEMPKMVYRVFRSPRELGRYVEG